MSDRGKITEVAIDAITLDHDLQSRVETDMEVVKDYADAMQAGCSFPPVVVFHDADHYWLADGFHRYEAVDRCGLTAIMAEVREGTRRDAILYSVGANAKMGVRPTGADKRKSVVMLLSDPEWFQWGDGTLAKHCCVSASMVARVRKEYCTENAIPLPEVVKCMVNGEVKEVSAIRKSNYTPSLKEDGRTITVVHQGRERPIGSIDDPESAKAMIDELSVKETRKRAILRNNTTLSEWLYSQGIASTPTGQGGDYPVGISAGGYVCIALNELEAKPICLAVGSVLILRRLRAPGSRAAVVAHLEDCPRGYRHLVRAASEAGIDFFSPDELVAAIKQSNATTRAALRDAEACRNLIGPFDDADEVERAITGEAPDRCLKPDPRPAVVAAEPDDGPSDALALSHMKEVLTTGDVARICCVASRTACKWIDNGTLKGFRVPGSADRRVRREDLIAFLRENDMPRGELIATLLELSSQQHGRSN